VLACAVPTQRAETARLDDVDLPFSSTPGRTSRRRCNRRPR
jgi:hypothetical protein